MTPVQKAAMFKRGAIFLARGVTRRKWPAAVTAPEMEFCGLLNLCVCVLHYSVGSSGRHFVLRLLHNPTSHPSKTGRFDHPRILTNSLVYGTRWSNAEFTRALQ